MTRSCVDPTDLLLLDALQQAFPLAPDPWEELGRITGISGEEVLARVKRMCRDGIIRGITPTLESARRRPGVSTLVAVRVPGDRLDEVAAIISRYPEVSHNFGRNHEYNLWFTLTAGSPDRLDAMLREIGDQTGILPGDMISLMTAERYKIDVTFPVTGGDEEFHGPC